MRQQDHLPGLAAAIVHDGELLWSQGYGYADADREVAVTADTPFWIASVSKSFVGLAMLHLAAEGKISLDDRAAATPRFIDTCEWLASTTLPFGRDLRCDDSITIRHILNHQVQGQPGSFFFYNPIMYSRLSRYVEDKLGEGVDAVEGRHNLLAQTVDRVILEPANMQRTMASQWDSSRALVFFDMAEGFKVDDQGHRRRLPRPGRHLAGGAGIVSTALDLAKYDIALDNGLIAPAAIREPLFTPAALNDGSLSEYAYGWYVQQYGDENLIWHSGWDEEAGYSAIYLKMPQRRLTLILLANSEGLWWNNPLDKAAIETSSYVRTFWQYFAPDLIDQESRAGEVTATEQ
ncbi:MAG: serine hydrolase domain-containing protein [Wenzhouxiangellaceae bacterium]